MNRVTREKVYTETGRFNPPALTVRPGETVLVETELCTGPWLRSVEDHWSPEKSCGVNPASGPIYVEGAQPGDVLAVRIDQISPDSVGYTGFSPGHNPFPDWIRGREWGIVTKTVAIREGFVEWGSGLRLPVRPMIGVIGTAPAKEVLANGRNGKHGGLDNVLNRDVYAHQVHATRERPHDQRTDQ